MSCIYGEHQSGTEEQGWVAHFVISALRKLPITVLGSGKQVRDVLHVEDLIRAMERVLRVSAASMRSVFNIGGGPENSMSILELLHLLEQRTGKTPQVQFSEWRPGSQKVYISDIRDASTTFDWTPEISPQDGVSRLVRWCGSSEAEPIVRIR